MSEHPKLPLNPVDDPSRPEHASHPALLLNSVHKQVPEPLAQGKEPLRGDL